MFDKLVLFEARELPPPGSNIWFVFIEGTDIRVLGGPYDSWEQAHDIADGLNRQERARIIATQIYEETLRIEELEERIKRAEELLARNEEFMDILNEIVESVMARYEEDPDDGPDCGPSMGM